MAYGYLGVAILSEIVATSFLKQSDGFTKPVATIVMRVAYVVSFYFLSLALRDIPTGIAYAIWSGIGIVLIAMIAWVVQGQRLDIPAMAGMALIIAGVLVMNLFSKTAGH